MCIQSLLRNHEKAINGSLLIILLNVIGIAFSVHALAYVDVVDNEQKYQTSQDLQLQKSSKQDYLSLGLSYETGEGVSQNFEKAVHFYRLAIDENNVQAIHNLGSLYNQGRGVLQNRQQALQLWQQASKLGNRFSSFNLGNAYLHGDGVAGDVSKALNFFYLSYEQGYEPALCQYIQVAHAPLCHKQELGYSDDATFSVGFEGGETDGHSKTLINSRYY